MDPCKQQNSTKCRSVWEQRTSQIRKHNFRASCEALYSELEPEDRLRYATTLHLRPDMKSHMDRPLLVEPQDSTETKDGSPDAPAPNEIEPVPGVTTEPSARKQHRHRDRGEPNGGGRENGNHNGDSGSNDREERQRQHRSRSKEEDGSKETGRGERNRSQERGKRHHRRASPEDGTEREHRENRNESELPPGGLQQLAEQPEDADNQKNVNRMALPHPERSSTINIPVTITAPPGESAVIPILTTVTFHLPNVSCCEFLLPSVHVLFML
eukprot:XP_017945660.1 PREDICTED: voltage-dependent N-type calcium channel subunit alpha-1B-like [Xenopus tropicalis]